MKYWIFIMLSLANLAIKAQIRDTLDRSLMTAELNFWQAKNDSIRFVALLNKVQIYRHANLYDQALTEADRADAYALTKTEQAELKYEKMIANFLSDNYKYCPAITFDSTELGNHAKEIKFMTLYSLNESGNWVGCKIEMTKYILLNDSIKRKEVQALPESYKYKDPDKSKRLSAILPGLGETYAGYPVKGITSLVLNAGFLAFTGYNIYAGYYVTSVSLGVFPFLKFYKGGKRLSVILADRHNEKESDKIKSQFRKEIDSILN